ncbi:reverse transcriptase domain-containing protein [Tanacetum coccineum]
MSNKSVGSKSATKVVEKSESSQPKPHLFLDQLAVDVTGTIVVMIGRVWDVNAITGRYLSTDFVISDSKGNMIHCTAKSNVAHNFLRLKEGGIYVVKNFVVLPNKDEFWIFKHDMFMLKFDGETTTRKVSADPLGYLKYPFQLMDFDQIEPANNKYLIDVVGHVTNVRRTTYTTSGSKTLDFYLANQMGQSLRVTLWGGLGDVLVERKTKHVGMHKLYLSISSLTLIYDDDDIPFLQKLNTENSSVKPTKAALAANCSQPKEGTLENLLIWARNRKNNVCMFSPVLAKYFVTLPTVDYPVFRYMLEVVVPDDTAHTVIVMFNDTATPKLEDSDVDEVCVRQNKKRKSRVQLPLNTAS